MWIMVLIFLAIMIPIIIFHDAQRCGSHKNYSRGVMNHDAGFREFFYRVDKSGEEIWRALKCHNIHTPVKYRISEADSAITFYSELPDGYLDITYGISIFEHEGYSILKIGQQNHLLEKNKFALLQNEFWHKTVEAVPISYIQQPMQTENHV